MWPTVPSGRTTQQLDLFVRLLEPMMLLVMAVVVMIIVAALFCCRS